MYGPKIHPDRIAQCVVALACAFALKLYYSTATADDLRWILAPTTALVEFLSGASFEFESRAGYISRERGFLIANSCSGVNFLITAFLMLSMRKLLERSFEEHWMGIHPSRGPDRLSCNYHREHRTHLHCIAATTNAC